MSRLRTLLAAFGLLVALAPTLPAQGRIVPRGCWGPEPMPMPRTDERRPRPLPMPCTGSQIARTHVGVKVELVDRVLRYEVEERFVNRGGTIGEADYLFPMPAGAAFQDLKLSIDGEMVSGETLPADEARRIYEEIVRRQRDPALVEWMGAGLLRTRIFPFNPGEERRIVVRYQVVAPREGDALRIEHRTGAEHGTPGVRQSARDAGTERATGAFSLVFPRDAGIGTPYSPTHALDVRSRGDAREVTIRGRARETFEALADGVTILLPVRRTGVASISMLAHAPGGEDGFALLTLSPPARGAATRATPRDVTLVLDVSGSMSGRKMEQARAAARQVLATLGPSDRFRIVDFATEVRSFPDRGLRDEDAFAPATRENLRDAERYVRELDAVGSTNIHGALEWALGTAHRHGRLGVVLFVTDGAPTVGEVRPERIAARAAQLRGDWRLFTFGVGADVNAPLLEQLALDGRGTAHFVRPDESVEHAVGVVASRLVDPVATDVRVTVEPVETRFMGSRDRVRLDRMHPGDAVDLFAAQDLVLLSRYRGSGRARVIVEGDSRSGPVRWSTVVDFPERERGNAAVARLWATQRVGWLAAAKRRLQPGESSREMDDEIRTLGERFGIPTEFTSYFVREPGMDASGRIAGQPTLQRGRVGRADASVATGAPVATAPAAAPEQRSFEAARRSAEQRAVKSVSEMADVTTTDAGSRIVGSRRFALDGDGRWTDARFSTQPVLRVAAWSDAYFELLRLLPELREPFALGERVLVAGRALAIEVASQGERTLPAEARARVRRDW